MKHWMLDIETMSLSNANALILSVGAVEFEINRENTGVDFGPEHMWVLNVKEQLARGRHIDNATVKWWAEQSDEAREHWLGGAEIDISAFRKEFFAAYPEDAFAWAWGSVFDLGNLASLGSVPWKYNKALCARTFCITAPMVRTYSGLPYGAAHDPIADCKTQCIRLWEHGLGDFERYTSPVAVPNVSKVGASNEPV